MPVSLTEITRSRSAATLRLAERRLEAFLHCGECPWVGRVRQLETEQQRFYCPHCHSERLAWVEAPSSSAVH